MNLIRATRYVLRVRTNLILIAASACGYYFLAGLQTFGLEFSRRSSTGSTRRSRALSCS